MMEFPLDQIEELKQLFPRVQRGDEGGFTYFLLPCIILPDGCTPRTVDALLCPMPRDGYPSRLFFSEMVQSPIGRNWNGSNVRILECNWHAFSWMVDQPSLRLAQMVMMHLGGLR